LSTINKFNQFSLFLAAIHKVAIKVLQAVQRHTPYYEAEIAVHSLVANFLRRLPRIMKINGRQQQIKTGATSLQEIGLL